MTETTKTPLLSNGVYDKIKWTIQYVVPALIVLYTTLVGIWGFPHGQEIVLTLAAIELALGTIMGISQKSYNESDAKYDGAVVIDSSNPEKDVYSLEPSIPLDEAAEKGSVNLKVVRPDTGSQL